MRRTSERASERGPRTGGTLAWRILGLTLALAGPGLVGPASGAGATQRGAPPAAEGRAAVIERELAEAQLLVELERDPAAAAARLEDLARRAADPAGFEGQGRALASIALARARLLAQLGRSAEALAALEVPWPHPTGPEPGGSALARAFEEARDDPRLADLRAALAPARQAPGDGDPVVQQVRRLIDLGQTQHLREPSRAQVRALEHLVHEAREESSSHGAAALGLLLDHAPLEAAGFLVAQAEGASEAFQRLVLRAVVARNPFGRNGAWSCRDGEPPILLEPIWRDLLERLLVHGGSRRSALPLLAELAKRDALTPPLGEALSGSLFSAQPDLVKEAFLAIADMPGVACLQPLYEALLEHPEPALRHSAARTLGNYEDMGRLLEMVDSGDVALRAELARALGRGEIERWGFRSNCWFGRESADVRTSNPAERPAIARLCADPDGQVRSLAVAAAVRRGVLLPRETLLTLAGEEEGSVLELVSRLPVRDPALLNEFLQRLASSPRLNVARRVAQRLGQHDWVADPRVLETALAAFIEGSPLGPDQRRELLSQALRPVWSSPTATAAVARRALERGDSEVAGTLVDAASGRALVGFSGLPTTEAVELVALYLRSAFGPGGARPQEDTLRRAIEHLASVQRARPYYLAVARIPELPLWLRLRVLENALSAEPRGSDADSQDLAAILEALADPRWRAVEEEEGPSELGTAMHQLGRLSRSAAGELWNRVVAAALADPDFPSRCLGLVVGAYDPLAAGGGELARAILERWPIEAPFSYPVAKTLSKGQELGLEPALLTRGLEHYSLIVVEAMSRWREPAFLGPLSRALEPDWMPHGHDRLRVRELAVRGLANLLSDDAARALLACAERTGDEDLRRLCFEGLETIRTYQEARERWERRASEREARARASEHLVSLLADPDPALRSAALLALGELGEVRALPRVAELAVDPDPAVRAAALEALRRLRPAPVDGAQPGGRSDD